VCDAYVNVIYSLILEVTMSYSYTATPDFSRVEKEQFDNFNSHELYGYLQCLCDLGFVIQDFPFSKDDIAKSGLTEIDYAKQFELFNQGMSDLLCLADEKFHEKRKTEQQSYSKVD
jgi:hypothetical protein